MSVYGIVRLILYKERVSSREIYWRVLLTQVWDDTLKRLIMANPQDFVSMIIEEARYEGDLASELKNWTRRADVVMSILLHGEKMVLDVEIQSTQDDTMGQRLLEYNVLATREHNCRVISCVIYLREEKNIVESPLIWELPNGAQILVFRYIVMKMWEIPVQDILESGLIGLYPLLPLAEGGKQHHVVDTMIEQIVAAKQWHLLSFCHIIAGLVFTEEQDHEYLQRRFAVFEDILAESWVYQEIEKKGLEKGVKQGLEKGVKQGLERGLMSYRQTILQIVQARFPTLTDWVQQQLNAVTDLTMLQNMSVSVSLAQSSEEARMALLNILQNKNGILD